jgi:hypothetical protein
MSGRIEHVTLRTSEDGGVWAEWVDNGRLTWRGLDLDDPDDDLVTFVHDVLVGLGHDVSQEP